MSTPQAFKTARPRVHRKRNAVASGPPPVLQHILWVHNDDDPMQFDLQLTGDLASLVNEPATFELSIDGSVWVGVEHAAIDDDDHSHVFLSFAEDLSDATLWRVTTPGNWVFEEGELGEPMSGSVG